MRRHRISRLRRPPGGFTLVELLVVVLVVTILATIVLSAMFNATEAARAARTRAQITKINDLLAPIWESYRTRRVPIDIPVGTGPKQAAQLRLDGLRALMRMELPDRISDVEDGPPTGMQRPALSQAYLRRAQGTDWKNKEQYQGAECLYLILSRIHDGDTSALEFFRETEIGDVDEDGMPEILDGWGNPIGFIRWPAGFTADVAPTVLQKAPASADPDPFDPTGVYGSPPATYYLYPLVYSAGPDGQYHLHTDSALRYSTTTPPNDPFTASSGQKIGTPMTGADEGGFVDNIHNHFLITGAK